MTDDVWVPIVDHWRAVHAQIGMAASENQGAGRIDHRRRKQQQKLAGSMPTETRLTKEQAKTTRRQVIRQ